MRVKYYTSTKGYVPHFRKLKDSDITGDLLMNWLFDRITDDAAWQPQTIRVRNGHQIVEVVLEFGQTFLHSGDISDAFDVSKRSIKRRLDRLVARGTISLERLDCGYRTTLLNVDQYWLRNGNGVPKDDSPRREEAANPLQEQPAEGMVQAPPMVVEKVVPRVGPRVVPRVVPIVKSDDTKISRDESLTPAEGSAEGLAEGSAEGLAEGSAEGMVPQMAKGIENKQHSAAPRSSRSISSLEDFSEGVSMEEEGGCGGNQPAAAAAEQISLLPEVVIESNDDQMEIASWLGRQELESWRKVVKDRIWIKTTMDQARRHGKDVKWVINEFERALYWMVSKGEGKKSPKLFLRNWIDRELGEGKYGTPKQGRSGSRQRTTYIPAKPEPGKYDGIGKVYSEFEGEGAIPRPKGYEEP